jgi:hypothetical protein
VHIPNVQAPRLHANVRVASARRLCRPRSRLPITFDDLILAGEAILRAVLAAAPMRR